MAVRKIKGSWWVDFQINFTRHRKRSPLNSKAGAEAFEVQMRQELAEKGHLEDFLLSKKEAKSLQFEEFSERWFNTYVVVNNKPSEQKSKKRLLKSELVPFFGHMELKEIRPIEIEAFKAKSLKRGLSPKSINNLLTAFHKCLATAVEWGELDQVPKMKFLKAAPPPFRYLSEKDAELLIQATEGEPWKTMTLVALKTGMRFSELIALDWNDVNLQGRLLCVRRGAVLRQIGTPKNGKIRYIPLTQEVTEALKALPDRTGFVFHRERQMLYYDSAKRHLKKACRIAGIEVISWHVLRHTFASHLVSRGASLKAIQDLLGHSTPLMTQRYAHLSPEALHDTIKLLEPKAMSTWRQPEYKIDLNTLFQSQYETNKI